MAETRIYRIEEGSIIVLSHVAILPEELDAVTDAIIEAAGHDRFVVLIEPPEGEVDVIGPSDIIEHLEASGVLGQDS